LLPSVLGQATKTTSLGVAVASDQVLQVNGSLVSISVEFTRPNDTNAYAIGDMVSDNTSTTTMQQVANAVRVSGGSGYLVGVRCSTNKKSITPRFRVHLFTTTGATLAGDNVAYKEVYADSSKRLGYTDLPSMTTAADTANSDMSRSLDMTIRLPIVVPATSLYFVVETLDAFTPDAQQKFTFTFVMDQN
jgi:hypothetical protein